MPRFHPLQKAVFGWPRISVTWPDGRTATREVHWERGQPNRFEIGAG